MKSMTALVFLALVASTLAVVVLNGNGLGYGVIGNGVGLVRPIGYSNLGYGLGYNGAVRTYVGHGSNLGYGTLGYGLGRTYVGGLGYNRAVYGLNGLNGYGLTLLKK